VSGAKRIHRSSRVVAGTRIAALGVVATLLLGACAARNVIVPRADRPQGMPRTGDAPACVDAVDAADAMHVVKTESDAAYDAAMAQDVADTCAHTRNQADAVYRAARDTAADPAVCGLLTEAGDLLNRSADELESGDVQTAITALQDANAKIAQARDAMDASDVPSC
jgi:hypothetical protein